jgi:hypothetical protein
MDTISKVIKIQPDAAPINPPKCTGPHLQDKEQRLSRMDTHACLRMISQPNIALKGRVFIQLYIIQDSFHSKD